MKTILHKVKMFEAKALSTIGVNTKTRRRRFAPLAQNIGLSVYHKVMQSLILEKLKVFLKHKPQRRK